MTILLENHLRAIESPANILINDQIKRFREDCRRHGCARPYHHFAFGQSPFPPPPPVVAALSAHAAKHDYLPTAGMPELRETIAEYYRRHFDSDCAADQVVVSPGSKEMIATILAALQGTVLVPTPSWVSYLPQAEILKKDVVAIRMREEDGFKLTPEQLLRTVERIASEQKILILNHPHNPTGAVYSRIELEDLAEVCRRHRTVVIADEIYALTSFDPEQFTSMGRVFPEGTVVTGGLSKDRSAGGYRLGVGIFPEEPKELRQDVLKIAGSTYSCVAAPIQYAALTAYSQDDEVEAHMRDCCQVNALIGRNMSTLVAAVPGIKTSTPAGGFYLYVDFNRQRQQLMALGFNTCVEFARHMLLVEHTAVLPGSALLLPEDDFSARCSYVDYDGEEALAGWRRNPPRTLDEQRAFVDKYCPLLVDGVANIGRFMEQVRQGKRPEHAA